jgi:hypothetical protein
MPLMFWWQELWPIWGSFSNSWVYEFLNILGPSSRVPWVSFPLSRLYGHLFPQQLEMGHSSLVSGVTNVADAPDQAGCTSVDFCEVKTVHSETSSCLTGKLSLITRDSQESWKQRLKVAGGEGMCLQEWSLGRDFTFYLTRQKKTIVKLLWCVHLPGTNILPSSLLEHPICCERQLLFSPPKANVYMLEHGLDVSSRNVCLPICSAQRPVSCLRESAGLIFLCVPSHRCLSCCFQMNK